MGSDRIRRGARDLGAAIALMVACLLLAGAAWAGPPKIVSLTSPTHPSQTVGYPSRTVTFAWEGPPLSRLAASLGWTDPFPGDLGGWPVDVRGLALDGTKLYVGTLAAGIRIVDVSNPAAPRELGSYATDALLPLGYPVSVSRIDTDQGYVYGVLTGYGEDPFLEGAVVCLDASNSSAPVRLGIWNDVGTGFESCVNADVVARDGYLYLALTARNSTSHATEYWVSVWDVRDRDNPQSAGRCRLTVAPDSLALRGDYLYVGGDKFSVIDVRDPNAPRLVSSVAASCSGVALDDTYAYGGDYEAMNVFDVTQPESAGYLGSMTAWNPGSTAKCVAISGHYAYLGQDFGATTQGETRVIDLARPLWLGASALLRDRGPLGDRNRGRVKSIVVAEDWAFVGHAYDGAAQGLSIIKLGPKAYSYVFDRSPSTAPDNVADGTASGLTASTTVTASSDGVWYFHVRTRDDEGVWGPTTTRKVQIGTALSASQLTGLSPTAGHRKATVTVTGKDFGEKSRTSFVKFGNTKCAEYVSWSATRIKCKVPSKAKFGQLKVTVTTAAGTSNAKTFTVKR